MTRRLKSLITIGVLLVLVLAGALYKFTVFDIQRAAVSANNVRFLTLSPENCKAAGGKNIEACRAGVNACIVEYSDGGRPCKNTADCQGGCYVDFEKMCANSGGKCFGPEGPPKIGDEAVGHCRRSNIPCGNFWAIDKGKVVDTVNAD